MANITGTTGPDTIKPGQVSGGVQGGSPTDGPDTITGLAGNDTLQGGGDSQKITTVHEFKKQGDLNTSTKIIDRAATDAKTVDKFIVLEGNIVTQVESNFYQFKDETGSINVKIKDFGGVKVEPDDQVRLFGEAEYDGTELI